MPSPITAPDAITTPGGFLLVLSIVVPVAGVLLAFVLGDRHVRFVACAIIPTGLAIAVAILVALPQANGPIVYLMGAWPPPLGIALRADGFSAVMLAATAVVICAVGVFAAADFSPTTTGARASFAFWILLLSIWGALNTIFIGGDLFTLYVALELLTFAAVPLVSLDGRAETLRAALQYLLFALLGSVLYLLGAALLYGLHGTLDIPLLATRIGGGPAVVVAASLMTTGLLAKTALFPLHLWLPPAHAGAPAAASAVLSGLVVKGSFFIIIRLWLNVMPGLPGFAATQLLAGLGGAAILFGSIVALRQQRLKLLVAYSTIAQIGYLFLAFPLAFGVSGRLENGGALSGCLLQAVSHATAKAAMFMAAGSIYARLGQDQIAALDGVGRKSPISVLAFALSGLALMGLPPGGAYLAKELLLQAASEKEQWWWAVVLQAGGVLTGAYVLLVLAHALAPAYERINPGPALPRIREMPALVLALCSLLLGLVPWEPYLSIPHGVGLAQFSVGPLLKALLAIPGAALVAILLGRWQRPPWKAMVAMGPVYRAGIALSTAVEGSDKLLRQWSTACISLLMLAAVFGAAMLLFS